MSPAPGPNRQFQKKLRDARKERKNAERSLLEASLRLRTIFNVVLEAIITIDRHGRIDSFNPAAENLFGYKSSEVVGQNVSVLMPEPYRSAHDSYLENYLTTGKAKIIGSGREVTGRRKDGSLFPMDLTVSEMTLGGRTMFAGVARNITERKEIERVKNEFISTVSHELRTPLTSVLGSLGLVRGGAGGPLPEKAKAMIDIAHNNAERLVRLINDILDMEKIEAGKMDFRMEPLDVMAVVEQAIEHNRGFGEKLGVGFTLSGPAGNGQIEADRDRLLQVLDNLLSNAAKFSPRGEEVEVAVTHRDGSVRVAVADHGPGISEEFRARIFQKFTQSDSSDTRQKGGTGLGLSIAKAITERHGGNIDFDTEVGRGTTFYIDLPLHERHAPIPAFEHTEAQGLRILVCEDDPDIARLLELILMKGGFAVDVAYNAAEAKDLLARIDFAAMTLDLMLPDQDGISLIRELRGSPRTRALPIVVVSACAAEGQLAFRGNAVGIVDWLDKPIDEKRLMADIRWAVERRRGDKPHLLHVEDDPDILSIVSELVADFAEISTARTADQARKMLADGGYDLVILDLMLPDGSGEDLLPLMRRKATPPPPVIVFSAKEQLDHAPETISATLVKSRTSNDELLATIKAVIAEAGMGEDE